MVLPHPEALAEGEAHVLHLPLKDLARGEEQGRLGHAVAHTRDGEVAHAATLLGHLNVEQRHRCITAGAEAPLQGIELPRFVRREISHRHSVRPAAATVLPHALPGSVEMSAIEERAKHERLPPCALAVQGLAMQREK